MKVLIKNNFRLLLNYSYYVPYLDKRHAYMYCMQFMNQRYETRDK